MLITALMRLKQSFIMFFTIGFLLFGWSSDHVSASAIQYEEELKVFSKFADEVCPKFHQSGEEDIRTLEGNFSVNFPKLFSRILATVGLGGSVEHKKKTYKGVLQKDLAEVIKHQMDCKTEVVEKLLDTLVRDPKPKNKIIQASPSAPAIASPKIDRRELLSAFNDLHATANTTPDIPTRKVALYSLLLTGKETSDIETKQMIVNELQDYIRDNVGNWKHGEGGRKDARFHETDDIVIALQALQKIRRSSDGKVNIVLKNINFDHYNLSDHDFEDFDFSHSSFKHAALTRSKMQGTVFDHANLSSVAIWNADMSKASFDKANLQGAKFVNVDLTRSNIDQASNRSIERFETKGLREEQLKKFPPHD